MRREDAEFLRGRIEERCSNTLLAWLAGEGSSGPAENFWEDPSALAAKPEIRATTELARRFSLHVEGLPLLYNLLLAKRQRDQVQVHRDKEELVEEYLRELGEWAAREGSEESFEPAGLWAFMARQGARLSEPQRRFVEAWTDRLAEIGPMAVAGDSYLEDLVRQRELRLKGHRARLVNPGRLLDWSGRVGVGRMDFRWFRVRQFLVDLHRALER